MPLFLVPPDQPDAEKEQTARKGLYHDLYPESQAMALYQWNLFLGLRCQILWLVKGWIDEDAC